jgi:hypothetical protein
MAIELPKPVRFFFIAANERDSSALVRCFADDAVVRDEGRIMQGAEAISAWQSEAAGKYNHIAEPVGVSHKDGKLIVTAKVTGDFPGSPFNLDHVFTLDGDLIAALEIR